MAVSDNINLQLYLIPGVLLLIKVALQAEQINLHAVVFVSVDKTIMRKEKNLFRLSTLSEEYQNQ
jgi:hypothetical protein